MNKTGHCTVTDCPNIKRSTNAIYCEKHYGRVARNGTLELKTRCYPATKNHSAGYVLEYAPDHPLCVHGCYVYQHRKVVYDDIGVGPHPCHWCGTVLEWCDLEVDHLDANKQNNERGNLVPSCHRCNTQRGTPLMRSTIRADEPLRVCRRPQLLRGRGYDEQDDQ